MTITTCSYIFINKTIRVQAENCKVAFYILSIFVITLMGFPYQTNYMGYAGGIIIVLFSRLLDTRDNRTSIYWIIFVLTLFIAVFEFPFQIREGIIALNNGSTWNKMEHEVQLMRKRAGKNPVIAATYPTTYFLFKCAGFDVVSIDQITSPKDIKRIDLFGLSYNGSKNPFKPNYPAWFDPMALELIYRPILPQQSRIFGIIWSNSSNTWEVELYKNK